MHRYFLPWLSDSFITMLFAYLCITLSVGGAYFIAFCRVWAKKRGHRVYFPHLF